MKLNCLRRELIYSVKSGGVSPLSEAMSKAGVAKVLEDKDSMYCVMKYILLLDDSLI